MKGLTSDVAHGILGAAIVKDSMASIRKSKRQRTEQRIGPGENRYRRSR